VMVEVSCLGFSFHVVEGVSDRGKGL
jgi:hypothetical protein